MKLNIYSTPHHLNLQTFNNKFFIGYLWNSTFFSWKWSESKVLGILHTFDKFLYKFSSNIAQLVWHQGKLPKSLPDIPLPFIFLIRKVLKRHWTICLNAPEKKERLILKTLNKELLVFNQTCINETHAHTGIIGLCLSRLTIDIAAIFTVSAFAVTLIIGNELLVYSPFLFLSTIMT